jgi:hypothetical protein
MTMAKLKGAQRMVSGSPLFEGASWMLPFHCIPLAGSGEGNS